MNLKNHQNLQIGEVSHFIEPSTGYQELAFIIPAGTENVGEFIKMQFNIAAISIIDGTYETTMNIDTLDTVLLWMSK